MKKYRNPFTTGSPTNPDNFFGRVGILNEIYKFLDNPNQSTFLINGQRRIGKTSFLRKIQKEVDTKGFQPVYFDLQNNSENTLPEILHKLMQAINVELKQKNEFNIKEFEKDYDIFENKFLKNVLLKHKHIVLLFDEFDVLGDRKFIAEDEKTKHLAYVRFVPYLQELIEKKLPLKFIFAIGRTLDDLAEYYGPIKKFAQVETLSYFELDESKVLLNYLTDNSIRYPQKTIELIHNATFGHPYFLQCLSSFLFDTALEKGVDQVSPDEIEKQLIPAIKKYSGSLTWFWEGFKPEEKAYLFIISTLTESKIPINEKTIREEFKKLQIKTLSPQFVGVLDKLLKFDIISKDHKTQNYKLQVPFIQKWIVTAHTIESFLQEVRRVDKIIQLNLDLGKTHMENEEHEVASEYFKTVLKREPENFEAQYFLALALHYGNLGDIDKIIDEFEKAYPLNPDVVRDIYLSILKKASEKSNKLKYLEKILVIDSKDDVTQEKLLQLYLAKWKNEFERGVFSSFTAQIESTKWLVNNTKFKFEIEKFIEKIFEEFINTKKFKLVIDFFDVIPESLLQVQYYKWVKKANVALIDNVKKEEWVKGREEGFNLGKEEGIIKGKTDALWGGRRKAIYGAISLFVTSIIILIISSIFLMTNILPDLNLKNFVPAISSWPKDIEFNIHNLFLYGFSGIYGYYQSIALKFLFWTVYIIIASGSITGIAFLISKKKLPIFILGIIFLYTICTISVWGIMPINLGLKFIFRSATFFTFLLIVSLITMFIQLIISAFKYYSPSK